VSVVDMNLVKIDSVAVGTGAIERGTSLFGSSISKNISRLLDEIARMEALLELMYMIINKVEKLEEKSGEKIPFSFFRKKIERIEQRRKDRLHLIEVLAGSLKSKQE
jgi:hypothetical protein